MSLRNWVRRLYGAKPQISLREMYIPGSHNSGAYRGLFHYKNWARTQELSVYDQLCIGVRHLDLRLALVDGVYYIAHRYLYMPFSVVIGDIARFTRETDEIVILSVKEDQANMVQYEEFHSNMVAFLQRNIEFVELEDATLGDLYSKGERVVLMGYGNSSLNSIWPNTMSQTVLLDIIEKYLLSGRRYDTVVKFDYIYTITAGYIAMCYLCLLLPLAVIFLYIFRGVKYVVFVTIIVLFVMFWMSAMIPAIAMPHLANNAKYVLREFMGFQLVPHIASYDYVSEDINKLVIDKNFLDGVNSLQ